MNKALKLISDRKKMYEAQIKYHKSRGYMDTVIELNYKLEELKMLTAILEKMGAENE